MMITSAISVQRPGLASARPAAAQAVRIPPVAAVPAAPILQAPRTGDAAWLTLLMAQALGGPRRIDLSAARRAYEPRDEGHPAIFALLA